MNYSRSQLLPVGDGILTPSHTSQGQGSFHGHSRQRNFQGTTQYFRLQKLTCSCSEGSFERSQGVLKGAHWNFGEGGVSDSEVIH